MEGLLHIAFFFFMNLRVFFKLTFITAFGLSLPLRHIAQIPQENVYTCALVLSHAESADLRNHIFKKFYI